MTDNKKTEKKLKDRVDKNQSARLILTKTKSKGLLINKSNLLALLLVIMIVLIGWLSWVRPAQNKADEISATDIGTLETRLEAAKLELLRINNLNQALSSLPAEARQRLAQALPSQVNETDLIVNLTALGEAAGLELTNLVFTDLDSDHQVLKNEQLNGLKAVAVTATYDGISYTNLKSFLSQLEKNLRIMNVNNFKFDPRLPNITFQISSFYLPTP
jgi:Tfp pilus assembly protein PilO